jgi:hypothetical protein
MFLAVRNKALGRLEDALEEVEHKGTSGLTNVEELSVAEREASRALGFDWSRYRWVRDEVARIISAQRQREDSRLLALELARARDDLRAQLKVARDQASRQFLQAQLTSLETQLGRLEKRRQLPASEIQEMELIDSARAEIAVQQGRQERIQKRVRDLLERARATSVMPTTLASPGPTEPPASTPGR